MPTLFDSLSKNLTSQAASPPMFAPQQADVASGLRAKSGKAPTSSTAPKASNVGESAATGLATATVDAAAGNSALAGAKVENAAQTQQAKIDAADATLASQTRSAQAQQAQQAQLAGESTQATEQMATSQNLVQEQLKIAQINNSADQTLRSLAAEKETSVDNIFQGFESSEKELLYRRDASELEQIGFNLAMRDRAYVDEINRIGAERDLNDKLNFKAEMQDLVLGTELSNAMDEMGFKTKLNASQREWDYYIASIDVESAERLASAAVQDAGRMAMIGATGSLAKAGTDGYSAKEKGAFDSDYQNYRQSGGRESYANYNTQYDTGGIDTEDGVDTDTADSSYGGQNA